MTPRASFLPGLVLLSLWLQDLFIFVLSSETVYFDKYGHCSRVNRPFDLRDEQFTALAKGGGLSYEAQDCVLHFKAAADYGVCVTFKNFKIEDCRVRFLIYQSRHTDDEPWKELSCATEKPSQMCTSKRYVTLRVLKSDLTKNRGYDFQLEIKQSLSVTDEGVIFASIGFVIGIISAVVIFLILIALLVFCCCRNKGEMPTKDTAIENQLQPSAPPLLEGETSSMQPMPLYPSLQEKPMLEPPPPYELPPCYSPHNVQYS